MNAPSRLLLSLALLAVAPPSEARLLGRSPHRQPTSRTVVCRTTVDVSPGAAYRMWTTEAGVTRFFAPAAHIEARVGGRYEILFAPDRDPEGISHGTAGAHVLRLVPDRLVAFEWIAFAADSSLGRNAPPIAPREIRDERPLPTWVVVEFEPLAGQANRTRVTLRHLGFRRGPLWDRSYAFFDRAWAGVLQSFHAVCAQEGGVSSAVRR